MRVDKSRHHDHVAAIEHRRPGRSEALADSEDFAVPHVYIAIRDLAEIVIHRQDEAAPDEELSAAGETARGGCRA
jgi:hypothetical protein